MLKEKFLKIIKSPALADIWRWSDSSHPGILLLCVLNLMICGCALVITVATRGLIDGAADHNGKLVLNYAILMTAMLLVSQACVLFSGRLSTRISAELLQSLRSMVLEKILKKQYDGLAGFHSGELVNRMFSDISVIRNGIVEIVPGMVSMAVSFVGAAVILIRMDWRFVVFLIAGGILGLLLIAVFNNPMKRRHRAMQEAEGRLHAILQETLENLRLIKASGSEKRMMRQVDRRQETFLSAQLRKGYFVTYLNSSIHGIFQLSWLFCMLWGCFGIYNGELTYGMLAAIIQLVGQIQNPIANIAGVASQIYGTISSAERLKEVLDLPEEEEMICIDGRALYQELTWIKLCDIDYSYGRGTELVLNQVNVSIKPGDFVAVTGISGGGKSTLFQLLLGIYQPTAGAVKFCFADGREENASGRTRALFAYVPQGNTLFSGTLRENLTMFTDVATDEEILQAVKIACIEEFISELADGLDTVIGERGIGLSEGQAQRVAVARALLSRAPILLLDESTSALDEETEAGLLRNIASLRDRTCLIVTHRKAALRICDYRIHIENGKVTIREESLRERII